MITRNSLVVVVFALLSVTSVFADESPPNVTRVDKTQSTAERILSHFGLSYFSIFSGPGPGLNASYPPALSGSPADTGLNFFNLVSLKYRLSQRIAVDLQFRSEIVVTNHWEYRHQGQRLGISGDLLKGDTWSLSGAFNTDVPIAPLMGQMNTERTLLIDPGLFAFFNWQPVGSKWSVFALVQPRVWFYRDRQALAVQDITTGGTKNKYEYDLYVEPTINYALNPKMQLRSGVTLEWTKFVGFDSITRNYMPLEVGFNYDISKAFSVYTQLLFSTPLDDGLRQAQGFAGTPWWKTASVNLWLSGTLF